MTGHSLSDRFFLLILVTTYLASNLDLHKRKETKQYRFSKMLKQ